MAEEVKMRTKTEGRTIKAILEEIQEEDTIKTKTGNFRSQYQNETKPVKCDATFQAYNIDGKSLLEAPKKLAAYNILKQNGPETNYSRCLLQHNPNLKGRFNSGMKQETHKQLITEDETTVKEITEAFFAVMGQEISEEEASLIQNIQLPDDEVDCQNEDQEASEEESTTT